MRDNIPTKLRGFLSRDSVKVAGFVLSVVAGGVAAAAASTLPWWGRIAVGVGFALGGFGAVSGGSSGLQPLPRIFVAGDDQEEPADRPVVLPLAPGQRPLPAGLPLPAAGADPARGHAAVRRALALGGAWVVSLALAAAAGRFSRHPEVREVVKVETRTEWRDRVQVQEVVRWKERTARHVETRTEKAPDGRVVVTRTEDTREVAAGGEELARSEVAEGEAATRATSERTESLAPSWRLATSAGWRMSAPTFRPAFYGAGLSRRLAGPFWAGAWADTDRRAGVALAVEW